MKKTVAVMLLCLLGVFAFAVTSFAETTEDGLFDYEILTDSENEDLVYAQITKYNGEIGGDLTLPDELGGYPVMHSESAWCDGKPFRLSYGLRPFEVVMIKLP